MGRCPAAASVRRSASLDEASDAGRGLTRSVQLLRVVYWLALGWLVVIAIPEFFVDVTHPVSAIDSWAAWLGWVSGRFVKHVLLALALVISLRYLIRFWDTDTEKSSAPDRRSRS